MAAFTLLFYDNASADGTFTTLQELMAPHQQKFREIHLIQGKENLGFGRAHNASVHNGRSEYVLFLNPDTELSAVCLNLLLNAARRNGAGVVAWEARQMPYEHPKIYDPITMEAPWSSAACLLVRREAFDRAGGFDRNIFLYGEDVDLSWRLQDICGPIHYVPQAVVVHNSYSEPGEIKPAQLIGSVRANLYLRTRYGSWRDIGLGLLMHLSLICDFSNGHPLMFRAALVKSLLRYPILFRHFRKYPARRKRREFFGWDYAPVRLGAFHDCSRALALRQMPKVSVLVRTTGRKELLAQALASLANQTYQHLEVIVVEDGAETILDFLRSYEKFGNSL